MENNDLNQAKGSQKSKTQIAIENAKWIWLGATIIFFVLLIVFYHNLHQKTQGKELRYFTSDEIGVINNIYLQSQHNDSITEDETEKLVLFYIKTMSRMAPTLGLIGTYMYFQVWVLSYMLPGIYTVYIECL